MLSGALVHYSEPREDGAVGGEFIWRCMCFLPAAHASAALRLEAQGLQSTYQLRVLHYALKKVCLVVILKKAIYKRQRKRELDKGTKGSTVSSTKND